MDILFKILFGQVEDSDLQKRIYTSICFIIALIGICLTLFLLLSSHPNRGLFLGLNLTATVVYSLLYYFSRILKKAFPFLLLSVILLLNSFLFFISGGLHGQLIFLYILAYIVILAIFDKYDFLIATAILSFNIILLYLIDIFVTKEDLGILRDIPSSGYFLFPGILFFSGLIFYVIKVNYEEKNMLLTRQKDEIGGIYKNLTDSVKYATKIQAALLPSGQYLSEIFPEHFVLYMPRDLVSGDFYWASKVNNKKVLVAADCTGHGVPGAFMSMLGVSMLNEIVVNRGITHTNNILEELRKGIKHNLSANTSDGMDISIVMIDMERMQLQFSGANSPLIMLRGGQLIEYKGERQPVGNYPKERPFVAHEIEIRKGDTFYMFSDGFQDQIGGEKNKKYLSGRFKDLLLSIHEEPMQEQIGLLNNAFDQWRSHVVTESISLQDIHEFWQNAKIPEENRKTALEIVHEIRNATKSQKLSLKEMNVLFKEKLKEEMLQLYIRFSKTTRNQIDDVMVLGFKI